MRKYLKSVIKNPSSLFRSLKGIDKIKEKRIKQRFTGKIILSEDYIVDIHGVLYHEDIPNGEKKIDIKVQEKKKKKEEEEKTTIAVIYLTLDKDNHCKKAVVEDVTTGGKSVTTHNKQQSELILNILFSLDPSSRMGQVYKWIWSVSVCVCVRHHFKDDHFFCS